MARSTRSQSQNSSLAGKTTLDSEHPDTTAERGRPNHATPDGGDLEDGEISEDAKSPTQDSALPQFPAIAEAPPPSAPGGPTPSADATSGDGSPRQAQPAESPPRGSALASPLDPPHGRALSDEELDRAKSLVLDLLGWGVEPEYLVECGVSAPVLYRIFTDLRLRLPTNLALVG